MALSQHTNAPPHNTLDSVSIDKDIKLASDQYDAEKNPSPVGRVGQKSPGGRIAPVLPHLRGYDFGDSDSLNGSDILGKQIEMEADNALQYRTCSWPKVRNRRPQDIPTRDKHILILEIDCGITFLGIHLSGYHEFPLLLLRVGSCSRTYPHCRGGSPCPIHFFGCLGILSPSPRSQGRV